jgi:hypothetical protein
MKISESSFRGMNIRLKSSKCSVTEIGELQALLAVARARNFVVMDVFLLDATD